MGAPETLSPKGELDLESNTRYEYDPWLLDDHPLRSHPTECIPGLGSFLAEWLVSVQKRWKEILLRAMCLILTCLAAFQLLCTLPSPTKALPRPATASRLTSRDSQITCTFPHSDPRANAIAQSVAAGCEGFRTDIWMHDNELQMGLSSLDPANDLHLRFDSLLVDLELQDASMRTQILMKEETPSSPVDDRTFTLVLDARSPIHELYSNLVSHLDTLRQRGYLTHCDGAKVVQGAVTIVVTGDWVTSSDCSDHSYSDVFWYSKGAIFWDGVINEHLIPICAV
ncbi:uncharacterized protein N7498_002090 [Penicillium cinerascens]|uniref:Uncharacterized protein n=1 Tax=Penicillium cinerascens TaxID=70096 RepID=A0A9W9N9D1_9EURO|nr:uncharacterized protein N7498_002090 [Penicillium cinerascens]KAJ5215683.1 hypothetical protein N7498_002090 [Penicillium cinerascens]